MGKLDETCPNLQRIHKGSPYLYQMLDFNQNSEMENIPKNCPSEEKKVEVNTDNYHIQILLVR